MATTQQDENTSLLSTQITITEEQETRQHISQKRQKKQKSNTVKSGYLKMRKSTFFIQTWRTYYCILKKSVLVYKNKKEDKRIAGIINLSKVSIWSAKDECGKPNSFMIFHPLREPIFLVANSAESMKSWMTEMQSVKNYLALYDNSEDYTSSDDEVTCCGKAFSIPFRKKGLPPQIFDDYLDTLSMNQQTPNTPAAVDQQNRKSKPKDLNVTCKYDVSTTRDDAEVSIDMADDEKLKLVEKKLSKVAGKLSTKYNVAIHLQFEAARDQSQSAYIQ